MDVRIGTTVDGQAAGFESALRAYVTDCLGGKGCPLAGDVDTAMKEIAGLLAHTHTTPLPTGTSRRLTAPLAFTGICTGELCRVRDDMPTFANDDVQVVSISVDSVYSHKIFSEREGYEFPLLADFWPHGAVAKLYGVFNDVAGIANRGTFLVDKDGIVRFAEMNGPGEGRNADDWRAAIKNL